MNITAVRLVIVATSTGLVVMHEIFTVVVVVSWIHVILSLAATHYHSSLLEYQLVNLQYI